MTPKIIKEKIILQDGREIILETGKLAKQADGSVIVKLGNTMLLATVVANKDINPNINFLPLTIEYREKFTSIGKVPGGFLKREGRPSDEEILTMRLVDRVLRPLFPKDFHSEIQIMISVISYDGNVMPDSLAGLAASAALTITNIPFNGPISEVRVIRKNGILSCNPSWGELQDVELDIILGASKNSIIMLEGEMQEISESELLDAIIFGHKEIKQQIESQERLAKQIPNSFFKRNYPHDTIDEKLKNDIYNFAYEKYYTIAKHPSYKNERNEKFEYILNKFIENYHQENIQILNADAIKIKIELIKQYFNELKHKLIRELIINENIRLDGRNNKEIRLIWSEVNYLPNTHGSSIFTRGETQSLTSVTLGSTLDANRVNSIISNHEEKFYLHYNFPPFATGEIRPLRGISRREIGHGSLAKRALKNIIPKNCPYTIRIVSDVLESNGSSSMATVCAGTLALMDAGIQIKKLISGISMGLILDEKKNKYIILSDILGEEDQAGDMDFKITGSENGITACQMDIKVQGLNYDIIKQALKQAKKGRLHVLEEMKKTLSEPRKDLKNNAPKISVLFVSKEFIGSIIGPGGKNIQQLQKDTKTIIVIEELDKQARVEISGTNKQGIKTALSKIKEISFTPEVGEIYHTKITAIKPFGIFVELVPGIEGLVHISEIEHRRIENIENILKIGDKIDVKFMGFDEKNKMKLSRKALIPKTNIHNK